MRLQFSTSMILSRIRSRNIEIQPNIEFTKEINPMKLQKKTKKFLKKLNHINVANIDNPLAIFIAHMAGSFVATKHITT